MTTGIRAGGTGVAVARFALMITIHTVLVAVLVAGRTAESRGVVRCMAFIAGIPLVLEPMPGIAVDRESGWSIDVVRGAEWRSGRPCRLRMTAQTIVTQTHCLMICRRVRTVIIALMALVAIRIRQLIISAGVTIQACDTDVRTCKWEIRRSVGKCRRSPRSGCVADRTVGRELIRSVRRVRGTIIIRLVASQAVGEGDVVVPASMAIQAGSGLMRASERKCRRSMIEC